jgi:anionic cell wall polymer biosynthesis LytR-Cps2A-Psr (LCP) family protein
MKILSSKLFLGILAALVLFISGSLVYLGLNKPKTGSSISNVPTPFSGPNFLPTNEPETNNNLNILLLGYGGAGHDGGDLTDSIILANINPQTKKVNLISIPRDLWVNIPGLGDSKINAAYPKGVDIAKNVVQTVTGKKVDYYISIDFSKFTEAIDLLGGIDVNVPQSFTDNFYPVKGLENETCGFTADQINEFKIKYTGFDLEKQFTCRYEKLVFTKGPTHMDGATALKYVRSRHSDTYGSDFSRSERQQAVLLAIRDKILNLNVLSKTNPLFNTLVSAVKTDIGIGTVDNLIQPLGNITEYQVNHIYLTDQNVLKDSTSAAGAYILIPKDGQGIWSGIQSYIKSLSN